MLQADSAGALLREAGFQIGDLIPLLAIIGILLIVGMILAGRPGANTLLERTKAAQALLLTRSERRPPGDAS